MSCFSVLHRRKNLLWHASQAVSIQTALQKVCSLCHEVCKQFLEQQSAPFWPSAADCLRSATTPGTDTDIPVVKSFHQFFDVHLPIWITGVDAVPKTMYQFQIKSLLTVGQITGETDPVKIRRKDMQQISPDEFFARDRQLLNDPTVLVILIAVSDVLIII